MNTATMNRNRHFAGPLAKLENSDKRGAALILEIIIYLVIVALIAVAVISGVRAIRDLVFTSHAKGDVQQVQSWVEGKYTQDNVYPNAALSTFTDAPQLTTVGSDTNTASVASINTAGNYGYCIVVTSRTISDVKKAKFWLSSNNPSQIMQSGTATANGGAATSLTAGTAPTSGIASLTCPIS